MEVLGQVGMVLLYLFIYLLELWASNFQLSMLTYVAMVVFFLFFLFIYFFFFINNQLFFSHG